MKKTLIFGLLMSIAIPLFCQEGTTLRFVLTTGSDDLRGGNNVYLKINFKDGTSSIEMPLASGLGQNNEITVDIDLTPKDAEGIGAVNLRQIKSITLRHDGSPRNGHPFDTYDNWDLMSLRIALLSDEDGSELNIYNSANDPKRSEFVQRFTGQKRKLTVWRQR